MPRFLQVQMCYGFRNLGLIKSRGGITIFKLILVMDVRRNSNVFFIRRTGHREYDIFDEVLTNIYAEKRRYINMFSEKNAG